MRTQEQMATIATRRMKDLHLEIAKKWGIPAGVLAGTTLGLGVSMMFETGYAEEQIVDMVRQLVADLTGSPDTRGAS
jgi:phosphoribosylformylglycinamidine (FGAM) synthase-like enzyme